MIFHKKILPLGTRGCYLRYGWYKRVCAMILCTHWRLVRRLCLFPLHYIVSCNVFIHTWHTENTVIQLTLQEECKAVARMKFYQVPGLMAFFTVQETGCLLCTFSRPPDLQSHTMGVCSGCTGKDKVYVTKPIRLHSLKERIITAIHTLLSAKVPVCSDCKFSDIWRCVYAVLQNAGEHTET